MRASLDTNAIIHFYRAGLQNILFEFFDEGVFIYEQIRKVELENHGQEVLIKVDADVESGKIEIYTDEKLRKQFEDDIMPFTFADVLILRYLVGTVDETQTVRDFEAINNASNLNWSFRSQLKKFVKRFWKEPYKISDSLDAETVIKNPKRNYYKILTLKAYFVTVPFIYRNIIFLLY